MYRVAQLDQSGLGFSLKPPKWLKKAVKAVVKAPLALVGRNPGTLLIPRNTQLKVLKTVAPVIPGVGIPIAAGAGVALKVLDPTPAPIQPVVLPAPSSPVPIYAAQQPGGGGAGGGPVFAPAPITNQVQAKPEMPSWLLPALGVGLVLLLSGRPPRGSSQRSGRF